MRTGVSERGVATGRSVAVGFDRPRFAGEGFAAGRSVTGRSVTGRPVAGLPAAGRSLAARAAVARFATARFARGRFTKAGLAAAPFAGLRRAAVRFVGAQVAATRSDRGSATVWSVGAIAVLCVVFGGVLALGQAVVVRHRAAGGADLAALAAADHWADGPSVACALAEGVARDQGARLVRCAVVGEISDVTAASGRGPFTAEARARAGPAGPVPSKAPLPPDPERAPSPGDPGVPGAPPPVPGDPAPPPSPASW